MATRRRKSSPDQTPPPDPALPPALLERQARNTDDPSAAILRSAGELLARKSPSEVSLREIALHAGVNYGLIHRHFGTKDELVLRLFQAFSDYGGSLMRDTDSIYTSLRQAFTAESGAFAEIFAWVILDRVDPERVWGDRSAMHEVAGQIRDAWEKGTPPPPTDRAFDPRVVASLSALVIAVWEFYAPYVAVMGDYQDREPADVNLEVLELLQLLVAVTRPG
jgi:AcrR family transcriptional regulator